jgi:hypothetical protein
VWGNPLDRALALAEKDVGGGFVLRAATLHDYRDILVYRDYLVDEEATRQLRNALR